MQRVLAFIGKVWQGVFVPTRSPLRKVDRRSETVEQRMRRQWAASLGQAMADFIDPDTGEEGMTRKQLVARLDGIGVKVSMQTAGYWLRGDWSPKPQHQAAIAKVLGIPVSILFPITFEAAS